MKLLGLFSLFIYSSHLLALTCTQSPEVNLSSAGESLENLRVTDQNGLGICHIEQLHKMIKAKLPGHPDLSRVQLAMAEKTKRDEDKTDKKAIRWMSPDLKSGGTYIDAGNSCNTFNLIKGSSICLAMSDQFEQITTLKPNHQAEIMHRLAYYFDNNKKSPTIQILGLLKDFGPALENKWQECTVNEEAFDKFKNAYSLFILSEEVKEEGRFKRSFRNTHDVTAKDLMLTAQDILSGVTFTEKLFEKFKFMTQAPEEVKSAYYDLIASYRRTETCMLDQISNVNRELYCAPIGAAETRVLELNKFGLGMSDILRVLKGDSDRDQFFNETFKCISDQKVQIPDINCHDVNLLPMAKAAEDLLEYQKSVASKIDEQLAKGVPVGISTCTRWFKNPAVTSVSIGQGVYRCGDQTDPEYKKGEGSHAVTIIGSRCKNGQPEYLVQNSWGNGCFYAKEFECTKKGGFWAPASILINNIRRLNYLE